MLGWSRTDTVCHVQTTLKKLFTDSILMPCYKKFEWMLHTMKTTRKTLVGYFMLTVLTDALLFLVGEIVKIVAGEDIIKTYHASLPKT